MFAAVCAWLGAGIFPSLRLSPEPAAAIAEPAERRITLEGVALREEEALFLPENTELLAASGERIPAGAQVAFSQKQSFESRGSSIFLEGCDGYEELRVEEASPLSVERVEALLGREPGEPGQARLVSGFEWYYAAVCAYKGTLPKGEYRLGFAGFEETVEARLTEVSEPSSGRRALLFRLPHGDTAYLMLRKTTAELILPD